MTLEQKIQININMLKGFKKRSTGVIVLGIVIVIIYLLTTLPRNMEILFVILFILVLWTGDAVEKRLRNLERPRIEKSIVNFSVNPFNAIVRNKKFGEMVGLKTNTNEFFKDWSKSDFEKFNKKGGIREKIGNKLSGINFAYFERDDIYFVRDATNYSRFINRRLGKTCLYSETIVEDKDGSHLDLDIYERIPGFRENPQKILSEELVYLTVCLNYTPGGYIGKNEFTILCELPLGFLINGEVLGDEKCKTQWAKVEEYIKKEGFEVREDNNEPWGYKDDFGEEPIYYSFTSYKKNGVEITVY